LHVPDTIYAEGPTADGGVWHVATILFSFDDTFLAPTILQEIRKKLGERKYVRNPISRRVRVLEEYWRVMDVIREAVEAPYGLAR
jgi:hypothetical protein